MLGLRYLRDFLGDYFGARRAELQARIEVAETSREAAVADRQRLSILTSLRSKSYAGHLAPAEHVQLALLESGYPLYGYDRVGAWRDAFEPWRSFDRGGYGVMGRTSHRGGIDFPYYTSEEDLDRYRAVSRDCVKTNDNARGLLGGLRRYTLGSGATVRVSPKDKTSEVARDRAAAAQAFIDAFNRRNKMRARTKDFFNFAHRDGEGVWRLFPNGDGTTDLRHVWPEQIRQPPGADVEEYTFGVKRDPEDAETRSEYSIYPFTEVSHTPDLVPASEIVYFGPNSEPGLPRSLPDFIFGTGDSLDLADKLADAMGAGSKQQADIAYIREHSKQNPASSVRAFPTADATYQQTNVLTGQAENVKVSRPGTIIDTTENTKFLPSPYAASVSGHLEVFQMLCRRAHARWNAPEWLGTSFSQEVNFASSLTAESPFVLTVTEEQSDHCELQEDMYERVLAIGIAAGRLQRDTLDLVEVKVTLPSPQARDKDKEASRTKTELENGTISPQTACEEAGREFHKIAAERKEVGLPPVGTQAPQGGPGDQPPDGDGPGEPDAPDAPPDPGDFDPSAFGLEIGDADAVTEALLEDDENYTGVAFGKYFVNGKQVDKAAYQAAKGAKGRKSTASNKKQERAATAKASEHLKAAGEAARSGDHDKARGHRAAAYGYHRAAGHHAAGDHAKAEAVKRVADEFASGEQKLGGEGKPATPAGPTASPPAVADYVAGQAEQHASRVAAALGFKDAAEAKGKLQETISQAVEAARASGSGSVVITGPNGKRLRITVKRKVSESEGAGDEFEVGMTEESESADAATPWEAVLLERGFTGEITDSAGHKRKYIDGKQVAHEPKAGEEDPKAKGKETAKGPPDIAPDAPPQHEVLRSVAAALPDSIRQTPGLIDKAMRVAAKIYVRTFARATELAAAAHRLAPEILDTAEDYENIGKQKTNMGAFAGGALGNDPFAEHLGLPGVVVLGSILPKVVGAAHGWLRSRRGATESLEWAAGLSDEDRIEIAKHTVDLWKSIYADLGIPEYDGPTASDVAAYLADAGRGDRPDNPVGVPEAPGDGAPVGESLLEAGFTGTKKDKLGREMHFVDGRHVPGAKTLGDAKKQAAAANNKGGAAKANPEHAAAKKLAVAKIKAVAAPPKEKVAKNRAILASIRADATKRYDLRAAGKTEDEIVDELGPAPRPGGDARGNSYARRARAERLFEEFGGKEKGYVVCHGTGIRMHYTDDPELNPNGYPKFEQGKIFTFAQGGGYTHENLLPESFAYNRSRNDAVLRPENQT
jgi:hypothetical protein